LLWLLKNPRVKINESFTFNYSNDRRCGFKLINKGEGER